LDLKNSERTQQGDCFNTLVINLLLQKIRTFEPHDYAWLFSGIASAVEIRRKIEKKTKIPSGPA
jgi:hypothetical protein